MAFISAMKKAQQETAAPSLNELQRELQPNASAAISRQGKTTPTIALWSGRKTKPTAAILPVQQQESPQPAEQKTFRPGDWMQGNTKFHTYTGSMYKPFDVEELNQKYFETVDALNGQRKKGQKEGTEMLRDAFLLVDDYGTWIRDSVALQDDPDGTKHEQSYLAAGETRYQKMLREKIAEYKAAGSTPAEMKEMLSGMGYEGKAEVLAREGAGRQAWREGRDAYKLYAAETEKAWQEEARQEQDEQTKRAEFFRALPDLIERENSGELRFNDEEKDQMWQAAVSEMPEDIIDLAGNALWGMQTDEGMRRIRAWAAEMAGPQEAAEEEAPGRAFSEADYREWLAAQEGYADEAQAETWMDWARDHRDQRAAMIAFLEKMADEIPVGSAGEMQLSAKEATIWEEVQQYMPENVGDALHNVLWGSEQPGDREKVQAYALQTADTLRSTADVYADEQGPYNEDVQALLTQYRQTPEGAREWLADAEGTGEEQQARANLWYVDRRNEFKEIETQPDFSEKSQANKDSAYLKSMNKTDRTIYSLVNQIENADSSAAIAAGTPIGTIPAENFALMEPEEVAKFNYLWETDREQGRKYLDYLSYALNERAAQKLTQYWRETGAKGGWNAAGASAASLLMNMQRGMGALETLAQGVNNKIPGQEYRPIDINTPGQAAGQATDAARQGTMEGVDWNVAGMDVFDKLYGPIMSLGDAAISAAAGKLFGGGATKAAEYLTAFFMSSGAAQGYMNELKEQGANDDQIIEGGVIAGFFESFFEKFSVGAFFKDVSHLGKRTLAQRLYTVGKEAFVNFSEEAATELADIILDNSLMGENSKARTQAQYYAEHGFSEEEANEKVAWELARQVYEAGESGAIMGVFSGEAANIGSRKATRSFDRSAGQGIIQADTQQTLKEIGMTMPAGSKARSLAEGFTPGKAKAKDVGALYREIYTKIKNSPAMQQAMKGRLTQDVAEQLMATGGQDAANGAAAAAIVDMYSGEEITPEQAQAIAQSQGAMAALRQLMGVEEAQVEDAEQGKQSETGAQQETQDAAPAVTEEEERALFEGADAAEAREEAEKKKQELMEKKYQAERAKLDQQAQARQTAAASESTQAEVSQAAQEESQLEAQRQAASGAAKEALDQSQWEAGEEQQSQAPESRPLTEATVDEKPAQVQSVTADRDGDVTVHLSDGQAKSLNEIDVDDTRRTLLEQSSHLPGEDAPGLMENYADGQDAHSYGLGYRRIYEGAKKGKTLEEIHSVFGKSSLTEAQQQAAFAAGRQAAARENSEAMQKTAALAARLGYQALDAGKKNQTGVVFARVLQNIGEQARKQLRLIDQFARDHGLQVRLYDTLGADNGSYQTGTNIINLALDADAGALTRTVSHEGYHFLKNWSQEAAQKIQSTVADALKNTQGYDLDSRVRELMDKFGLSEAGALEEITADSMLDVIGREETAQAVIAQDKSVARKIADWLSGIVKELQGMLRRLSKSSPEIKAMLGQQAETLKGIQDMYLQGLDRAAENYRAAQEGATQSARQDANVQEYMQAMEGGEDRQTALNGLISQLFFNTQGAWLQENADADLDEALQRFADALTKYRREGVALRPTLEAAGFAAPENMTALSYAADQLLGMARDSGEKHSPKLEAPSSYIQEQDYMTEEQRETLQGYLFSVDPQIKKAAQEYKNNKQSNNKRLSILDVSAREAHDIKGQLGIDVTGYKHDVDKNFFDHVEKRHGQNGEQDQSMADLNDVARIKWVIENYDAITAIDGSDSHGYMDKNDAPMKLIRYEKSLDGSVYVVEAVGENKWKKLHLVSAYIQKNSANQSQKSAVTQAPRAAKGLGHNVQNALASPATNSIAQDEAAVKHSRKAEDVAAQVEDDAALHAQVQSDRDARAALELLQRLDESVREEAKGGWQDRLGAIADKYRGETGGSISRQSLMKQLRELYTAMEDGEGELGEKAMYARQIALKAIQQTGMALEMDEGTKEALRLIKNRGFFLTDDQKSEIAETYGDVRTFVKKNFGRMAIRSKGSYTQKGSYLSLTDLWSELHDVLPGTFQMDVPEVDMPGILDAFLDGARDRDYSPAFGADGEAYATDLAYRLMLEYYDVPTSLKTAREIRQEFRQKLEDYKANYKTKQEKKMQASAERTAATERKNKLRSQISRDVKYLNIRNVAPTDSRHIPAGLREAAIRAVAPFTESNGVWSGADASRLAREYALLGDQKANSAMDAARMYDPEIEEKLQHVAQMLEGRRLSELTEAELEDLRDIVGNLKKMIEEANEMRVQGRKMTLDSAGETVIGDMERKKRIKNKRLQQLEDLTYKNMTPAYFADRAGGIIKEMVDDLFEGQNKVAFTAKAAKEKGEEIAEKYKLNDWINGEHLQFETQRGEMIELSVGEALALYATWKRETTNRRQNANHLRIGGFTYGPKADYKGVDTKAPHAVTAADMQRVMDFLGAEKMAYADEMVKYLSEDMAKLGNETSMTLYGYEKFKEGYYFPYSSDKNFLYEELTSDSDATVRQVKNAGFTKETVQNASNPILLGDFLEVWAGHVNQMALYHAFAETTDNLNRLYNYRTPGEVRLDSRTGQEHVTAPRSVKQAMETALGKEAGKYLKTLVKDVNGGVANQDRTAMGKGLSLFKKASVAANWSVTVQQPSAIMRAMNMVNPKYFLKQKPGQLRQCIREMNQWSGVAIIKDIGRFDTGTGQSMVEWLTDFRKDKSLRKRAMGAVDTIAGWAPEKADQITWANLWQAVKNETEARSPELDPGSEDFMRAVAARFNDVCNHTQVYDSTLSKSSLMRSQNLYEKLITSFMAEPTVSFNMLLQGLQNINKPGGKKAAARAMGAFLMAVVVNALRKSFVTAGRRKDDDERTIAEKYLAELVENIGDDLNLLGTIPIARDVLSIFQGYDVNRSDVEVVSQFYDAYKTLTNKKKTAYDKIKAAAVAVGTATGVPVKNVWRDVEGALNLFRSAPIGETSARDIKYSVLDSLPFGWDGSRGAYYQRIAQAALEDNTESADEMRGYLEETEGIDGSDVTSGVKSAVKEGVEEGRYTDEDAMKILTKYLGTKESDAFFELDKWKTGDKKYDALERAIDSGEDIPAAVKKLTEHGMSKETLSSQLTTKYKKKYIELYKTNRTAAANLKAALLAALTAAGYDRETKAKAIDKWLEEKKQN